MVLCLLLWFVFVIVVCVRYCGLCVLLWFCVCYSGFVFVNVVLWLLLWFCGCYCGFVFVIVV